MVHAKMSQKEKERGKGTDRGQQRKNLFKSRENVYVENTWEQAETKLSLIGDTELMGKTQKLKQ